MSSSIEDGVWDEVHGRWAYWNSSKRHWVDEDGRRVSDPRRPQSAVAGPSQQASSQHPARMSQPAVNQTPLITAMAQLNVGGTSPLNAPSGAARRTAPYTGTALDRATGLQTSWDVSQGVSYRDPKAADTGRSVNTKHIRGVAGRPTPSSSAVANQYRVGRVIEVLLVPPEAAPPSAVSGITPRASEREGVRLKRFVIVQILSEQRRFRALPIKTYAGRGVAAFRVVKSHHSIIYTDALPAPNRDERPRRLPTGQLEDPMQPQAILVLQRDRMTALDPMSRLDYGADYTFDFGVPNIRLFGRVHQDSLPFLFAQWNSVYYTIRSTAGSFTTASSQTIVASGQSNPQISSSRTVPSTTPAAAREEAVAYGLYQQYSDPNSGPCTEAEMQRILNYLYAFGRRQGWRVPNMAAAAQRLPELARNASVRAGYIQQIRIWWAEDDEEETDEDSEPEIRSQS